MFVLGIVLMGLSAFATTGVLIGGAQPTAVELTNLRIETSTAGFFGLGFGLAVVFLGGLQLVVTGVRRWLEQRHDAGGIRRGPRHASGVDDFEFDPAGEPGTTALTTGSTSVSGEPETTTTAAPELR